MQLRPPQPAVYIFLLDISFNAIESRYLDTFCERLSSLLDRLPGDARTQIAIIAFDSAIHFFQLETDWKMLTVADIEGSPFRSLSPVDVSFSYDACFRCLCPDG